MSERLGFFLEIQRQDSSHRLEDQPFGLRGWRIDPPPGPEDRPFGPGGFRNLERPARRSGLRVGGSVPQVKHWLKVISYSSLAKP
jgi:hypothetical protein